MAVTITVSACRPRAHLFEASLAGRVLGVSRQPLLDAARVLLAEGHDPHTILAMRHAGSDTIALSAKLGAAAKLTVDEGSPYFRAWRAMPPREGSSRIDETAAAGSGDVLVV
jgi:hypothetical protein